MDTEEIKENLIASMQKQIVEEDENVSEEEETIHAGTEENIVNDIEKNADKFGMQVQEKYEDI